MTTPTRPSQAQDGFILIEVLVSALILAIVAGAVLTLVTATTRGAASQRTHAVAYGLAQEAQAELRTKRIGTLTNWSESKPTEIGGTRYVVEKQSVFVSNTTQTVSCGSKNDTPDYIRLTTTVSAPTMANPVTIRSVVSPTNGSLDPNVGSLQGMAKNAAEEPLAGVKYELTGQNGATYRGFSEPTGCVSFGDIPSQIYTVKTSATGLVNKKGESSESAEVQAPESSLAQLSTAYYDRPGSLQANFVVANSATGALEPANVDAMQVSNTGAPVSTPKTVVPTPPATRASTLSVGSLFPFAKSNYTVYAGTCEKDNPDPTGTKTANDKALGTTLVPPGGAAGPLQIQVPALNLTVKNGTAAFQGATIALTDSKCGTKRTYRSNSTGNLATTTTGPTEPGLPWGTYKICILGTIGGKSRRYAPSETVAVENLTTAGTALTVNLATATEDSTAC